MTETKNFALKLPDPTDMVDIGALNENFEKIDEELTGGYFELDLRGSFEIDSNALTEYTSYDLSEYVSDLTPLIDAVKAGKKVKFSFVDNLNGTGDTRREITVPMDSKNANEDGAVVRFSGRFLGILEMERYSVALAVGIETNTASLKICNEYAMFIENGDAEGAYDLDLRETVALTLTGGSPVTWQPLTAEHTDLDALWAIADIEKKIRIRFQFTDDIGDAVKDVILENISTATSDEDGSVASITYNGYIGQAGLSYRIYSVGLLFNYAQNLIVLFVTDTYTSYRAGMTGGSTEVPTGTTVVKSDSTVTITTTLEGDKQSVTTITVDENDYPTKINTDGTEWPVTWEGFEAAEDDSVGLPVVELSTMSGELTDEEAVAMGKVAAMGVPIVIKLAGVIASVLDYSSGGEGLHAFVGNGIAIENPTGRWMIEVTG